MEDSQDEVVDKSLFEIVEQNLLDVTEQLKKKQAILSETQKQLSQTNPRFD